MTQDAQAHAESELRRVPLPAAGEPAFDALQRRLAAMDDTELEPGPQALSALALGAPPGFDRQEQPGLPVLLASRATDKRQWEVDFNGNLHLFCVDLSTGALLMSPQPLVRGNSAEIPTPSRTGPPPEHDFWVVTNSLRALDLAQLFENRWPDGRYTATAIVYDRRSNTVAFDVRQSGDRRGPPTPMAAAAFVHPGRLRAADRPSCRVDGALLQAAFRLPAGQFTLPADALRLYPVNLVLLRLDDPRPHVATIPAPMNELGDRIDVSLALDVRDALPGLDAGAYQAYVFVGDQVAGPMAMQLTATS
ncbi:hypothetical protein [Duganella sp. S19_KUP01_CR8]|uniref:hypothetical protein n=1 Tax=Duganella sp. S19_KUP01_CR8 TaxID=3025502 RepID=UPI002FCD76EC